MTVQEINSKKDIAQCISDKLYKKERKDGCSI